ncbi:MAG: 50S ribosomal protein L10 [Christensenellaceae bacterium]|nr:50S ribosomal protein L10 [Christensenellaceae bacterium]
MKEATLKAKESIVSEIQAKIEASQSIVFIDYRGLTVSEVTDLRNKMRAAGVEYKVLKNTMVQRAAKAAGIEGLDAILEGPTAVAFGLEDAVAPAKIIAAFAKATKKTQIKGGVLEGKVIDEATVKSLAEIPSRNELLARMLGSMTASISGFVRVIAAIRDKKEEAEQN